MKKFWDKLIYVIMAMVAIVTFFITGFVGFLLGSKTIYTGDQELNKQILNLSSENIKKLNTGEKIFCADGTRRNVVEIDSWVIHQPDIIHNDEYFYYLTECK